MSNIIKSGSSSTLQEVDAGSLAARTTIYGKDGIRVSKKQRDLIPDTQEFLMVSGKNDSFATALRTDRKGNLLTGNYVPELIENFEGSVVNVQKWGQATTTFAPTQTTTGGYNINSTNQTAANAVHLLQSQRVFYKFPRVPLQDKVRLRANIPLNSVLDFGFGIPSGTTLVVPNGAVIRVVNGLWFAVLTSNNVEIASVNINDYATGLTQLNTANTNSDFFVADIVIDDDNMLVTVQNTQTGVMVGYAQVPVPLSALKMFSATALPKFVRLYNGTTAPTIAPTVILSELQVLSLDMNISMDASQIAANLGLSADRHPFTGAQLANFTNSTPPVSATLSNSTSGYASNILDGKWQFVAPAGANTDYALFAFQVPANSKFLVEGIRIATRNTGAIVATTPTTLEWGLSVNGSGTNLATANLPRITIDHQSFPVGATIEAVAPTIDMTLNVPQVCESGKIIHLILTVPVGTATVGQVIRGLYTLKGRFI